MCFRIWAKQGFLIRLTFIKLGDKHRRKKVKFTKAGPRKYTMIHQKISTGNDKTCRDKFYAGKI